MGKKSPVAVFLAASAILASNVFHNDFAKAGEENGGGWLKEWNTDQAIDDESTLDEAAKDEKEKTINKVKKKSKKKDICIPIGEGENCW